MKDGQTIKILRDCVNNLEDKVKRINQLTEQLHADLAAGIRFYYSGHSKEYFLYQAEKLKGVYGTKTKLIKAIRMLDF